MFEYNVPFTVTFQGLVPVKDTLKFALCPELILVLPDNDAVASVLTVMANVRAVLDPQLLLAVTLNVPEVAVEEKLTVTLVPVPVIVAPVPE